MDYVAPGYWGPERSAPGTQLARIGFVAQDTPVYASLSIAGATSDGIATA